MKSLHLNFLFLNQKYNIYEFLKTLKEAVKVCGWSVDHIESSSFVGWCFQVAGKDYPSDEELQPYSYEE